MTMQKLRARLKKAYATNALRLYQAKIRFDHWHLRHGLKLVTLVLLVAVLPSVFAMPFLQRVAGRYFSDGESLTALRTLLAGTGAALIGGRNYRVLTCSFCHADQCRTHATWLVQAAKLGQKVTRLVSRIVPDGASRRRDDADSGSEKRDGGS